jgi:hypothetical protein
MCRLESRAWPALVWWSRLLAHDGDSAYPGLVTPARQSAGAPAPGRYDSRTTAFAAASLILGLISVFVPYGRLLTAPLVITLAVLGERSPPPARSMAMAGLILGLIVAMQYAAVLFLVIAFGGLAHTKSYLIGISWPWWL